jgi:hypothetical protein
MTLPLDAAMRAARHAQRTGSRSIMVWESIDLVDRTGGAVAAPGPEADGIAGS